MCMRHVQLFISLIALLPMLSSCRSDDPLRKIVIADSPATFNYVVNTGRAVSEGRVYPDAGYYMVFDDDMQEVNLTISNLQYSPECAPVTVSFSGLQCSYDLSGPGSLRIIEADVLVPDGAVSGDVMLTDVVIVYSQANALDSYRSDGFYARYTVNGNYRVTAYPYSVFGQGTTRIMQDAVDGDKINYDVVYETTLDPKSMSASIRITGLPMLGDGVSVDISGIGLVFTDEGYELSFASGNTSVKVSDGTASSLSRLVGDADMRDRFDLDIDLAFSGVEYRISAFLTPNLVANR